jgi:hypothetical protein
MPFVVLLLLFLSSEVSAQSTASAKTEERKRQRALSARAGADAYGTRKRSREELASATKILNEQRAARHKELEGETVPSPELARALE